MGTHALVLNASFEPMNVVSWQRAVQLLFQGKVEVIEESDREIRTVSLAFRVPSVLRLLGYINISHRKQIIRFSRANVFARDRNRCQYCTKTYTAVHLTLDHVIPVVQGGGKIWENIVTSCKKCNQKKGGRTPLQAGMKLTKPPRQPKWLPTMTIKFGVTQTEEQWKIYLSEPT